ncbi:MAG: tetratricopeptide repeat protein, partial [Smithella sp.]
LRNHFILIIFITVLVGIIQMEYIIPSLSTKYYNKAWNMVNCDKKYNDSLTYLNIAIGLNHRSEVAYIERGWVYVKLKDYNKAIPDYTRAIDLNPNFAMSFYGRGFAYYYIGDYSKAVKDWNAAISIDPKLREELDKWIDKAKE